MLYNLCHIASHTYTVAKCNAHFSYCLLPWSVNSIIRWVVITYTYSNSTKPLSNLGYGWVISSTGENILLKWLTHVTIVCDKYLLVKGVHGIAGFQGSLSGYKNNSAWHWHDIVFNNCIKRFLHKKWDRDKIIIEWKSSHFEPYFTEVCSWAINWQKIVIGLGNGMVSSRRQAITWINGDHGPKYVNW